jgi:hypothetical protein
MYEHHEYRNVHEKLLHKEGTKSDPAKGNQLKRNSKLRQKSDSYQKLNQIRIKPLSYKQAQLRVSAEADLLLSEYMIVCHVKEMYKSNTHLR